MEYIRTDRAPLPLACYSQAVKVGDLLFVAGQVSLDPKTRKTVEGGIEAQTRQVLENLPNTARTYHF
jgi:2-iminobutanoate/2-iminopropanoate deaminase